MHVEDHMHVYMVLVAYHLYHQAVHLMRRGAVGVENPLDCSHLATLGNIHWEEGRFKVLCSLYLT